MRKRDARDESGFTLIELLIALVIIGILLVIAVPSYLGFKDRGSTAAAEANVRSAVPAVEAYYADNGSYSGMTAASLAAIDAGITVTVVSADASTYCISDTRGGVTFYKNGPAGSVATTSCVSGRLRAASRSGRARCRAGRRNPARPSRLPCP